MYNYYIIYVYIQVENVNKIHFKINRYIHIKIINYNKMLNPYPINQSISQVKIGKIV